jgi:hypothetical protein
LELLEVREMEPERKPPIKGSETGPGDAGESGYYKRTKAEWHRMKAAGEADQWGYVWRDGGEARGYTWQQFGQLAGTSVPAVIEPMVMGILEWVLTKAREPGSVIAYLLEEQYQITLDKWARAEARRIRFEGYLDEVGENTSEGRRTLEQLTSWDKRSAYYSERLGLDPPSLIKIRRDLGELHREMEGDKVLIDLQAKYGKKAKVVVVEGDVIEQAPAD